MALNIEDIKKLREETSVSLAECQKALTEANGDSEKAKEILRKKGIDFAAKKGGKSAKDGIIEAYVHPNKKIGVMLDIRCETDFVARSEEFRNLAHDLALHIAASNPKFTKPEDIPTSFLEKEKEIYAGQFVSSGKPETVVEKIIEGKLTRVKEEISLLKQPFVKDPEKTVGDIVNGYIAKLGENISVEAFIRYEI